MKIITKVTEISKINKNEYKGYFRNKNEPFFIKINTKSVFLKSNRGDIKLHCSIKDIENYDESFLFDTFVSKNYKKVVFNKTAALIFVYNSVIEYLLEDEDVFLKTELEEDIFIEKVKSIKGISSLKRFLNEYNLSEEEEIIKIIENSCLSGYENFSKVIKDINLFSLNESFKIIDKNILFKYDSKHLNKITILKEIIKRIINEKECYFNNKKRFG